MDKSLRTNIVGSVVASALFLYLLNPILVIFGRVVFGLAGSVHQAYLDRLFKQAASGTIFHPTFAFESFALGAFLGVASWDILLTLVIPRSDRIDKIVEFVTYPTAAWKKAIRITVDLCIVSFLLFVVWSDWFQLRIVTSFEQHMAIVSPYLTDQEAKQFRSRWALMQSEADYNVLYRDLDNVAKQHGHELPPNPIYTWKSI